MKVYIQSKSGKYNVVWDDGRGRNLDSIFLALRRDGAFRCVKFGVLHILPFEEIEYIREATDEIADFGGPRDV